MKSILKKIISFIFPTPETKEVKGTEPKKKKSGKPKLNDGLDRELSRQRRYQIRNQQENKCVICGGKTLTRNLCKFHAEKSRAASRKRYRLKAGIPLDAPIKKTKDRVEDKRHRI